MATGAIIAAGAIYGGYERNKAKKTAERIEAIAEEERVKATGLREEEEKKIAATKKRLTTQRARLFETEGGAQGAGRGTIFGN